MIGKDDLAGGWCGSHLLATGRWPCLAQGRVKRHDLSAHGLVYSILLTVRSRCEGQWGPKVLRRQGDGHISRWDKVAIGKTCDEQEKNYNSWDKYYASTTAPGCSRSSGPCHCCWTTGSNPGGSPLCRFRLSGNCMPASSR